MVAKRLGARWKKTPRRQGRKGELREAASAGIYHSPGWNGDYPKLQVITVNELLDGVGVKMPPTSKTFKQAEKVKRKEQGEQAGMF